MAADIMAGSMAVADITKKFAAKRGWRRWATVIIRLH